MRSSGEGFPGYCRVAADGPKRAEVVPDPLPLRATGGIAAIIGTDDIRGDDIGIDDLSYRPSLYI